MNFKNSEEFRNYLQEIWHQEKKENLNNDQEKWQNEFINISKKRVLRQDIEVKDFKHQKNHYDKLIEKYIQDLIPILPVNQSSQIGSKISIGSVNSNDINAVCTTDGAGNYAVIVNSSIFTYLHKFGKLLLAINNPSIITYCNRKNFKEITKSDLEDYIKEMPKIYFSINEPKGAMLHLNDDYTSIHMKILETAEKFILGHELGHYFLGHLKNEENTELFLGNFEKLKNDNHKIEFEADDFGLDIIYKEKNEVSKYLVSAGLNLLFQGLNSLNPYASESHPAPIERLNRLLQKIQL